METARKIYNFLLDSLQTLLMAAAVFLVIYMFLFRPFEVKGDSMFPTFKNNEYVLTNLIPTSLQRVNIDIQKLKTGEVVVFKSPTDEEKDFIKRIIGTPGDTVQIKDGKVILNGKLLDESAYLKPEVYTSGGSFLKDGSTVTVPEESYFVIGDNRTFSSDSREWGFVKKDNIIGRSFFVYWPMNQARLITNPYN